MNLHEKLVKITKFDVKKTIKSDLKYFILLKMSCKMREIASIIDMLVSTVII